MYKLKNMVRRSAAFTAAVSMLAGVGAAAVPAITFADALNPLTERSLMLSSSSPGWKFTDGSGNSTFAPAGSGPNGKKTGETFSFRVSTDSTTATGTGVPIKAFTLQYCMAPAGVCVNPGDGTDSTHSMLNINYTSPVEGTDFDVYWGETATAGNLSTGWSMTPGRVVTSANPANASGSENNFITLTNTTGIQPAHDDKIWLVFHASETNYITNPGSNSFFVKINDYDSDNTADHFPTTTTHVIDGGVTVANVMNDSIWIYTKVVETMAFSVGSDIPDKNDVSPATHGGCDPITYHDQLKFGTSAQEYSLDPAHAYDAYSYWRLATNSSAGATVYYSGSTLQNTVGDDIDAIGAAAATSHPGMEQFGLSLDSTADTLDPGAVTPTLNPLAAIAAYAGGSGEINGATLGDNDATFAFKPSSNTTPEAIASNDADVTVCSTGKMRYIANIAPSTPAGVYTTKINYIAAPQY